MEEVGLAPTLRPLLDSGEKILCIQNKVGLYQGAVRDTEHDNGTVYLTNFRIVYVDQQWPWERSVALHFSLVDRCSLHSGFLYSSAKIHIYLKAKAGAHNGPMSAEATTSISGSGVGALVPGYIADRARFAMPTCAQEWQCGICENINSESTKCVLCGVPRPENASELGIPHSTNPELMDTSEQPVRCPVCTFDNHSSMTSCEMCDSQLHPPIAEQTASTDATTVEPAPCDYRDESPATSAELLKLSFRAGGSTPFYTALKEALEASAWKNAKQPAGNTRNSPQRRERRPTTGGISTIVSTAHATERARDATLQSAFTDLDALIAMANEMVGMAEHIATQLNSPAASKLRKRGSNENDEDSTARADAFRQYLLDLGIDSPVTRDTAGAVFHEELARELCDYLENYVSQSGGTVALVDAYCLYNRAREFSLVYPSDFVQACGKFEKLGLNLRLREYPSGLLAIEDPSSASDALIISRINSYIQSFGPVTANELSALEDCPLTLAEERLWISERAGQICRDESVEGVRFYLNMFSVNLHKK
ncbi:Vacuolar protein-sorting-associated protein 36 [Coemansia brasiliensis]|uniref:Vacuolar protein-sorting-associated protein 36 n=1 Tax=Coemansia brasiliensis TaxID=2650707 RepID=A0A9W8I5I1_9FUNG|nr:Vacuolar protein-sorting-associated protein 36 [Coemansia brasiliensis]